MVSSCLDRGAAVSLRSGTLDVLCDPEPESGPKSTDGGEPTGPAGTDGAELTGTAPAEVKDEGVRRRRFPRLSFRRGPGAPVTLANGKQLSLKKATWEGMSDEEKVANNYMRTMDFVLMVPLICFYLFFGWLNQDGWQNDGTTKQVIDGITITSRDLDHDVTLGTAPTWLRASTVFLAMMSMVSLFRHAFESAPVFKARGATYEVMQLFGRWTFLTRWCLAFQCVHHTSCAALAIKPDLWPLAGFVPANAPVSGAVGSFVTVQFFSLVYPTARFLDEIEDMKKLGYPQIWLQKIVFNESILNRVEIKDIIRLYHIKRFVCVKGFITCSHIVCACH